MATPKQAKSKIKTEASTIPAVPAIPGFLANTGMQSMILFLFALLLYANTLTHGFVLDDYMVIKMNTFTQRGFAGFYDILSKDSFFGYFDAMKEDPKALLVTGGRYRPLSLLFFAAIYQFFGENAFMFHLFTVIMYALTGVLLYRTLILLTAPERGASYAHAFSWLATVLFIAHPVHVEAAANIKGCDEILSLAGSLGALYCAVKACDEQSRGWGWSAALCFFLALMSKENAATFLIIIPLALWFFRPNIGAGQMVRTAGLLFGSFVVFFVLRGNALNWQFGNEAPFELMNNPFIKIDGNKWIPFSPAEKLATVFVTLLKYIGLLFFPHPLTHDYYPRQIGIMNFGHPWALLGVTAYVGLGIYAFTGLAKRNIVKFGVIFYLLTLAIVSNLVFSVGTLMNERFLFMPSVGFSIAVAGLLMYFFNKSYTLPVAVVGICAAAFSLKTLARNPDWATNEKLFLTDVKTSANSAKAHDDAGGVLFNMANAEKDKEKKAQLLNEAIGHFNFALGIHPAYRHATMHRAASWHLLKDYEKSVAEYRRALQYWPGDQKVLDALALALRDQGNYYGSQKNDPETARKLLMESTQYNPGEPQTYWLIGVSFAKQQKFAEALEWFLKAHEKKPDNANYLYDVGLSYHHLGQPAKAMEYKDKAKAVDPEIGKKRGER